MFSFVWIIIIDADVVDMSLQLVNLNRAITLLYLEAQVFMQSNDAY